MTDTRRGWWPALELALLAFTVVVCGSVALLAHAHASALHCDHQCDTSGSNRSTATATSHDSVDDSDDDGDDDDDVGYALLAASIVLTSDDRHGGPRLEADVPLCLRSERLSSRGPPDYDHQCDTPGSNRWTATATSRNSSDDADDDDDDDDDDVGYALLAASAILTSDEGHEGPRVQTHVPSSLRSERLSSRGPPRGSPDRDLSSWTAGNSGRRPKNSPDDNIDNDNEDDDDSSQLGRSSPASNRGQTWVLIVSELDGLSSFASDDHSLRAPPQ